MAETLGSTLRFSSLADGKEISPRNFYGKAVLVVNTASLCGCVDDTMWMESAH